LNTGSASAWSLDLISGRSSGWKRSCQNQFYLLTGCIFPKETFNRFRSIKCMINDVPVPNGVICCLSYKSFILKVFFCAVCIFVVWYALMKHNFLPCWWELRLNSIGKLSFLFIAESSKILFKAFLPVFYIMIHTTLSCISYNSVDNNMSVSL
jgi:hypothetical protein